MQSLEHLAQEAGVFFVSGIWQGFVLAAAVGLCLRLVPRATAAMRFAIWTAVLLLIGMLPFLEQLFVAPSASAGVAPMLRLDIRWSFAIAAVWMAVSLFRAAGLAVHGVRLWSLRRQTVPVAVPAECASLLASRVRRVTLCTSDEVDRPSVIGFLAPRILIPTWLFSQLTSAELEQIVLHEMEHLRRGDDWLNLLQKISLVVLPLNPIVLWVERRLCFERELACDDGVLRRTRAPRAYATCLTSLAERGLDRRTVSLALGVIGNAMRQSELARRVHRILRREATLSPLRARALTGTVALGLLGGTVGLVRCPQVVSFAGPVQPLQAEVMQHLPAPVPASAMNRTASPARAEQVVFKESSAAHLSLMTDAPQMTDTVQRSPVAEKSATPKKRKVQAQRAAAPAPERSAAGPMMRRIRASANSQPSAGQGWVVLSSWTGNMRPQTVVPVVSSDSEGNTVLLPYAVVPTAGGWLILQL
jgi:beta-lactamase regulating signal transducer with metallopeptidase domain